MEPIPRAYCEGWASSFTLTGAEDLTCSTLEVIIPRQLDLIAENG
jgi:hypothetical protein